MVYIIVAIQRPFHYILFLSIMFAINIDRVFSVQHFSFSADLLSGYEVVFTFLFALQYFADHFGIFRAD